MPTIQVEGKGAFEVEEGKKLVLSLMDQGVDILHRCGGNARCATCRVEIIEGDAGPMNEIETAIQRPKESQKTISAYPAKFMYMRSSRLNR